MKKTLFEIIDSWTLNWNRGNIENTLQQIAAPFNERKFVFFLLEEFWNTLEFIDDPLEFMTEERKIQQIEKLLSIERNERAAKAVKLEIIESQELKIVVLNAEDVITENPSWFENWEGIT